MSFKDAMMEDVGSVFMNTDEFATEAIYRSEVRRVQLVTQYNEDADSFYKMLIGKFPDFDGVDAGDVIEVEGVRYRVIDAKPDDFNTAYMIYINEEL